MKVCNTCEESKSLDEFYKDKASKDGKMFRCKICNKQSANKWNKNNPERHIENTNKWQSNNSERIKENTNKWRSNNPERYRENNQKYHSILENKLKRNIRTQYNQSIPKGYRHDIIEILGCDIDTYIKYIESLWLKEFCWDNYGEIWEIDHIIPRNSVAFNALKSQRHIFGYKNTRPLFKTSQIAKSYGYNNIEGNRDRQKLKGEIQK